MEVVKQFIQLKTLANVSMTITSSRLNSEMEKIIKPLRKLREADKHKNEGKVIKTTIRKLKK